MIIVEKFTFKEQKDFLIPESPLFRPLLDKNGFPLNGDETLRAMATCAEQWEKKNEIPVPIAQQNFVKWLKQGKKALDGGMTSEEYFKKTIIKS